MDDIKSYSLIHLKSGREIKGKVFLKEITKSTDEFGKGFSVTSLK